MAASKLSPLRDAGYWRQSIDLLRIVQWLLNYRVKHLRTPAGTGSAGLRRRPGSLSRRGMRRLFVINPASETLLISDSIVSAAADDGGHRRPRVTHRWCTLIALVGGCRMTTELQAAESGTADSCAETVRVRVLPESVLHQSVGSVAPQRSFDPYNSEIRAPDGSDRRVKVLTTCAASARSSCATAVARSEAALRERPRSLNVSPRLRHGRGASIARRSGRSRGERLNACAHQSDVIAQVV